MKNHNILIFIIGVFLILPVMGLNPYYLSIFVTSFIFVIFTLSWDLIGGICGQVTLGHALFFGAGTYSFAILCTVFDTPAPAALLITLFVTVILALITGVFAIRLNGAFFALFTLALAEVAHEISLNIPFRSAKNFFMGGEGGVPLFRGSGLLDKTVLLEAYYLCLIYVIFLIIILRWVLQTTKGLELKSIAGNEMLARSCGIKTRRLKLIAYIVAALIATTGGVIFVVHTGRATPHDFSIELSFQAATLSAVGGRGNILGPAVSAFFITALFSLLEVSPVIRMSIYALVLPAMLLRLPFKLFPQKR